MLMFLAALSKHLIQEIPLSEPGRICEASMRVSMLVWGLDVRPWSLVRVNLEHFCSTR